MPSAISAVPAIASNDKKVRYAAWRMRAPRAYGMAHMYASRGVASHSRGRWCASWRNRGDVARQYAPSPRRPPIARPKTLISLGQPKRPAGVFNQHRGRVGAAQPVREDTGDDIGAAAGRKTDDHVGRL